MTDSPYKHLIGGALQAPEDPAAPRVAFSRPVGALPEEAWAILSNPQYQDRASSCDTHGVEFALASEVMARTGAHVAGSRMDIYYGARVLAGDWPNDKGSYPHLTDQWLRERGTLPEVLAPYDATKVTTWKPKPEWAARRAAWTAQLERMPANVDQIRAEIAAGRCVVVSHHVYDQMAGTGPGQAGKTGYETGGPFSTANSRGGHTRCIVSYRHAARRLGMINWWRGYGLPHPKDARFPDSYTEIDYETVEDGNWQFYLRRIVKGLEVKT